MNEQAEGLTSPMSKKGSFHKAHLLCYDTMCRMRIYLLELDVQLILALAWLVFGISVVAILLLMYMIREGETSRVVSYFYLVPPVAAMEAWLLFDETLTIPGICAMVVTVFGVYLVTKKQAVIQKSPVKRNAQSNK